VRNKEERLHRPVTAGADAAWTGTYDRRDAVAIGERKKSVPLDAPRGQLANRRTTRRRRHAASYQQLTLKVGEVHNDRRRPRPVAALKNDFDGLRISLDVVRERSGPAFLEKTNRVQPPKHIDEHADQTGPAGLMTGTDSGAIVAMEVFEK